MKLYTSWNCTSLHKLIPELNKLCKIYLDLEGENANVRSTIVCECIAAFAKDEGWKKILDKSLSFQLSLFFLLLFLFAFSYFLYVCAVSGYPH